ncbi:hypothetical protein DM01DRAFT_1096113 [Hesseltinella vesiculosa]|uniref:Uncharacterized protein n=1 Tax=Hesseltinella vesiculosa TaxID=101127 RepID=A0A1X2GCD1_9FUNG|nr:hypothetical protein DM01DRAFT_1096113 [Hesseltinella vesiculosa]
MIDFTLKCRLDLSFPHVESIHDNCHFLGSLYITCRWMKEIDIDALSVIVMNRRLKSIAITFDCTVWVQLIALGLVRGQKLRSEISSYTLQHYETLLHTST